jgi:transposase-like protein
MGEPQMTIDDSTRRKALKLLARGVATMSEVAELAGVSRQLVRYWAEREGLDPVTARRDYLARLWEP